MTMQLRRAERRKAKLRIGVTGPSGAGKTYSALLIARGLASEWGKIALIDTENGSGELYSHLGDYNVITLTAPYSPERYIEAIQACEKEGMEVIVIDSASHEWDGKGGCLEINEKMAATKFKGNTWAAWSETTPRHQKFIEALTTSPCHIIVTARSKTDTIQTEDKKIKKVGLKDIQREGFEYELTLSLNIDRDRHYAMASKDRTGMYIDADPFVITEKTGLELKEWAEKGTDEPAPVAPVSDPEGKLDTPKLKSRIIHNLKRLNIYKIPSDATSEQIGKYVKENVLAVTNIEFKEENLEAILKALEGMKIDKEDDQFLLSNARSFEAINGIETPKEEPKPEAPKDTPPTPEQKGEYVIAGDPWVAISAEDLKYIRDLATDTDWVPNDDDEKLLAFINTELGITAPSLSQITKSRARALVEKLLAKKKSQNESN